jgi:hypothetical protein
MAQPARNEQSRSEERQEVAGRAEGRGWSGSCLPIAAPAPAGDLSGERLRRVLEHVGDDLRGDLTCASTGLLEFAGLECRHFGSALKQANGRSLSTA